MDRYLRYDRSSRCIVEDVTWDTFLNVILVILTVRAVSMLYLFEVISAFAFSSLPILPLVDGYSASSSFPF